MVNIDPELLRRVLTMMNNCTIESGVCHCGTAMNDHTGYDGHSAVDEGVSFAEKLREDIEEVLNAME